MQKSALDKALTTTIKQNYRRSCLFHYIISYCGRMLNISMVLDLVDLYKSITYSTQYLPCFNP